MRRPVDDEQSLAIKPHVIGIGTNVDSAFDLERVRVQKHARSVAAIRNKNLMLDRQHDHTLRFAESLQTFDRTCFEVDHLERIIAECGDEKLIS